MIRRSYTVNIMDVSPKQLWYQRNRATVIAQSKRWHIDNRVRSREIARNNYRKHRQKLLSKALKYTAQPVIRKRQSDYQLRRRYGIGLDDKLRLIDKQCGKCAICAVPLNQSSHLDHCHVSGKIRGVLCRDCNIGLGHFDHNREKLILAAKYLSNAAAV